MNKKLLMSVMLITLSTNLFALSPYVKGYRLYIRYVKHIPRYGIKAPKLLKKLNIQTTQELDELIESGEIVKRIKKFNPAAAKGIEKALKKDKESVKTFLEAIYAGRIPVGCN